MSDRPCNGDASRSADPIADTHGISLPLQGNLNRKHRETRNWSFSRNVFSFINIAVSDILDLTGKVTLPSPPRDRFRVAKQVQLDHTSDKGSVHIRRLQWWGPKISKEEGTQSACFNCR